MTMHIKQTATRETRRFALAALAAISLLGSSAAFAEIKAKIGHAMPDSHPQAAAMNKFAELVSTYTKGDVKVQAYHSGVLGSDEKQLQAVQAGTQEFYIGTLAPLSTRVKEVQVWDLPFMFQNEREVYAVLDGASSKKIFTMIEPAGLVGLTWTGMGFRNLSNSKRSVNKLEDVSGLKVRVMANPVALETWKTIGANAVPMAFAEGFRRSRSRHSTARKTRCCTCTRTRCRKCRSSSR
jgi:TRAP-type transport system periplasmic protein